MKKERGALHGHEEAAERFLVLSGVLVVIAAAGLARGAVGRAARLVTVTIATDAERGLVRPSLR